MAEEFKISQDEAGRIREAMKKPEFRKLLTEYAEEISDPENKKKYEEELIALEKQRGVDMKYIHPKPGFVMKSFLLPESTSKIFINVCHNDTITAASCIPSKKKKKKGERWTIPYSLTPPREDVDKSNNKCTVVDAVFNTETIQKGINNLRFKQMLVDTVFDGLETQLNLKVDREKVIYLIMPYKGTAAPAVIRKIIDSKPEEVGGLKLPFPPLKEEQGVKEKARLAMEPKYTVLHRGEFTMQDFTNERESTLIKRPKELVVSVELPGVESAGSVELDIFERKVVLKSETPPYNLDLTLPYPIDEEKGQAKFDKVKKVLTVTLPVLPPRTRSHQPPADSQKDGKEKGTTLSPEDESNKENVDRTAVETDKALEENGNLPSVQNGRKSEGNSMTDTDSNEPGADDAPQALQENWSSKGEWMCPPFSYRQEDTVIVFCLHTANAKEKSLVKYFEEHLVQLTYSTDKGEKYSFHVSFPEGCGLDVDDCNVDISEDNIVLLLKKDAPETDPTDGAHQWDKFSVGMNSSQTTEKLFLTTSNVESVLQRVDDLPDPWKTSRVWSDSATASATSVTGMDRLDIEISDPEMERGSKVASTPPTSTQSSTLSESRPGPTNTELSNGSSSVSSPSIAPSSGGVDPSPTDKGEAEPGEESTEEGSARSTPSAVTGKEDSNVGDGSSVTSNSTSLTKGSEPSVMVEADGSVFIRGDDDYIKNREDIVTAVRGDTQAPSVASNKVKLSNKLMYSLD